MLDTLYKYAKFQYECGNYSGAAEYLYFYRVLVSTATENFIILPGSGRHGGLMVSVLDSGLGSPGSSPDQGTALCSWARHFTLS